MVPGRAGDVELELCRSCLLVWFDRGEYEKAPLVAEPGRRTLPQPALESLARYEARRIAADYQRRYGKEMPLDQALALVPGALALPLEADEKLLTRDPWTTILLAAVLAILGIFGLFNQDVAARYALDATEIDRLNGATLITAFFFHETIFQLATNVYFLLIFGDNVEDFLGPVSFGLLISAGALVGNAAHALFASNVPSPLMGASGGISAVVVFYALRFPQARLRYMRLTRWMTMPASAAVVLWILTKVLSTQGVVGRAEPSAWPYVGGALVGVCFWLALGDQATGVWSRGRTGPKRRARSGSSPPRPRGDAT